MIVDNFELIKKEINFESDDEFYFLQIIKRHKDGNKDAIGNNINRLIKYYIIKSKEDLNKYKEEIINLCNLFNARAYIHFSKRSFKEVAKLYMSNVFNTYSNENYIGCGKEYPTSCGQSFIKKDKSYLIDIDYKDFDKDFSALEIQSILYNCEPIGNKIKTVIPTLNGLHIISKPFNTRKFEDDFYIKYKHKIDIHKNNPTLLYYES